MEMKYFPTINPEATGKRIAQLRREKGLSVKDLQRFFGFEAPQAIYKWQSGSALPSVDNLLALCVLLEVSIDSILVTKPPTITNLTDREPEGSVFLRKNHFGNAFPAFSAGFMNGKVEKDIYKNERRRQIATDLLRRLGPAVPFSAHLFYSV